MLKFIWVSDGEARGTVYAENEEQAIRKVIAIRIRHCEQTAEEAIGWFSENDMVIHINDEVTEIEPYEGDISDLVD